MTASIIQHGNGEDNYDDASHPIPSITALDIQAIKKGGGSDLAIIIASPLQADERSQRRLLDKIQLYLDFLKTPEYESTSGVATPDNTSIIIRIDAASDPVIFELIDKCKPWVHDNSASLLVEPIEA